MVTLHVVPTAESQPDQPDIIEPLSGEAVSVTTVPSEMLWEQVDPQLMPLPVTVPVPAPALLTVRV